MKTRLLRPTAALALALTLAAAPALAGGSKRIPPPGDPMLELRPWTAAESPFSPSPEADRDEDCLDDDAEHAIAEHFRPFFRFDSRENALNPDEPVVLYRVTTRLEGRPEAGCAPVSDLLIQYIALYRTDGGFATSWVCNLSHLHKGDNHKMAIWLSVSPDGRKARLTRTAFGHWTWPTHRQFFHENRHPVVYPSAGKHHEYFDTDWDGAGYPYFTGGCREGVDGRGRQVLAVIESPDAPRGRNNVGEPHAHPEAHFVNDLAPLGFRGEDAWDENPFCGGYKSCSGTKTSAMGPLWRQEP